MQTLYIKKEKENSKNLVEMVEEICGEKRLPVQTGISYHAKMIVTFVTLKMQQNIDQE